MTKPSEAEAAAREAVMRSPFRSADDPNGLGDPEVQAALRRAGFTDLEYALPPRQLVMRTEPIVLQRPPRGPLPFAPTIPEPARRITVELAPGPSPRIPLFEIPVYWKGTGLVVTYGTDVRDLQGYTSCRFSAGPLEDSVVKPFDFPPSVDTLHIPVGGWRHKAWVRPGRYELLEILHGHVVRRHPLHAH